METQQIRPETKLSRAGMPGRQLARRDEHIHPAAALLGVLCVGGVFGLLWLLYSFG